MINPLTKSVASLSKYIRVEKYYELLASITEDTPERRLRSDFDQNLYVTAKARYLTVKGGMVLRDKLIDLVHVEGGFTERVKMVMYFLFMFRDYRYREFICGVVADKNGKWNASIFSDTHSGFFKGPVATRHFGSFCLKLAFSMRGHGLFRCQTSTDGSRMWLKS